VTGSDKGFDEVRVFWRKFIDILPLALRQIRAKTCANRLDKNTYTCA
jgi:hypothetical protein